MTPTRDTLVKLADVYENVAKSGGTCFVGYMGHAKVVMLKRRDTREGEPRWALFTAQRPPKPAAWGRARLRSACWHVERVAPWLFRRR